MAEPLKFEFDLLDRMAGPAAKIAKSVTEAANAMKGARPAGEQLNKSIADATAAMKAAQPAGEATTVSVLKLAAAEAKAATETRRLAKELDSYSKLLKPAKGLTVELGNAFHSFGGFRREAEGNWIFNLSEGLGAVVGVVERLGSGFINATGAALAMAAAGEKSGRAFRLNLGSGGGKDLLDYVDRIQKSTGRTREEIRGLVAPLVTRGVGIKDLGRYTPAALDVEARGGSAQAALEALGGVRVGHQISGGTLDALGLGSEKDKRSIAAQLGRQFGFGTSYAQKNPDAFLGLISERLQYQPQKVDKVVETLLSALAARSAGGKLGGDAANSIHSTDQVFERFQNIPTTLLEKLSSSGKLDGLTTALDRFTDVITGPAGNKFVDALASWIDSLANVVDKTARLLGKDEPLAEATKYKFKNGERADLINRAWSEHGALAAELKSRGYDKGILSDSSRDEIALRQKHKEVLAARRERDNGAAQAAHAAGYSIDPVNAGREFASDIGKGIVQELLLSKATEQAGAEHVEKLFSSMDDTAERASPSKRSARLGRDIVAGLSKGIDHAASSIDSSWMDNAFAIDDRAAASPFAGGGGLGGGMTLQIAEGAIQINGSGMDAEEVAEVVMNKLIDEAAGKVMLSAMEQFAIERGA